MLGPGCQRSENAELRSRTRDVPGLEASCEGSCRTLSEELSTNYFHLGVHAWNALPRSASRSAKVAPMRIGVCSGYSAVVALAGSLIGCSLLAPDKSELEGSGGRRYRRKCRRQRQRWFRWRRNRWDRWRRDRWDRWRRDRWDRWRNDRWDRRRCDRWDRWRRCHWGKWWRWGERDRRGSWWEPAVASKSRATHSSATSPVKRVVARQKRRPSWACSNSCEGSTSAKLTCGDPSHCPGIVCCARARQIRRGMDRLRGRSANRSAAVRRRTST